MRSLFKLIAVGLGAGILAAVLVGLAIARGWISIPSQSVAIKPSSPSATPGTDFVDRYRCRTGLTKLVITRGSEDGFSRLGSEPAVPRAALLRMDYFAAIHEGGNPALRGRAYDEIGADRILLDRLPVPRGIVSGALVLRTQSEGGSENDYVILGDIEQDERKPEYFQTIEFVGRLALKSPDAQGVIVQELSEFVPNASNPVPGSLRDYFNRTDRAEEVDFLVQDDTTVDFAALILCQEPAEARGTTLREFRSPRFGAGVSFLSCGQDRTQGSCNPFSGDMICRSEMPLACYRTGNAQPPAAVQSSPGGLGRHFVDGEVRLTPPVAGERFASLTDANRFCTATFGEGWRVLSYHDGGGGNVISRSNIPPLSRAWIDIRDQRYGNCWDRDKER